MNCILRILPKIEIKAAMLIKGTQDIKVIMSLNLNVGDTVSINDNETHLLVIKKVFDTTNEQLIYFADYKM